ncbi:putative Folate-sensitive fragile site protein Fra10Ac1 [Paratrimastix pyriformis]|uniref:Folate-sensitive fragile site protein Fra10Ac1 n=1 Tax=Paratrimastix pyriformis TaxID=342808 RepID=A0ABQ8UR76_9EUKA|nr:putative Folate-sensitive fragile site protein Fra10Ac1 [Paratrimastix pyriformis]
MNAWDRHQVFVNDYLRSTGKPIQQYIPPVVKTDGDVLREQYRFIRSEGDDAPGTWETELARKYYEKLFREYCIADMTHWKENKIGMRWRTEEEVLLGKGQFVCGNKACSSSEGLSSYEVHFKYMEQHVRKQALVKLRLCPHCGNKLSPSIRKRHKQQQQAAAGVPPSPSTPAVTPSPSPALGRTTFPAGGPAARLSEGTPLSSLGTPLQTPRKHARGDGAPAGAEGEEEEPRKAPREEADGATATQPAGAQGEGEGQPPVQIDLTSARPEGSEIWSAPLPAQHRREDDFEQYFQVPTDA